MKTLESVGKLDEIDTTAKRLVIECKELVLLLLREGCCQCFLTASVFHLSMSLQREDETHSSASNPLTADIPTVSTSRKSTESEFDFSKVNC